MEEIVIVSNIVAMPFINSVMDKFRSYRDEITFRYLSLTEIWGIVNEKIIITAKCIVVLINFSELIDVDLVKIRNEDNYTEIRKKILEELKAVYDYIKCICNGYIIWFGLEGGIESWSYVLGQVYSKNQLIDDINVLFSKYIGEDDVYIDLKGLVAKTGLDNSYNEKNKYRWNSPYSETMWQKIVNEINRQYMIYKGITKKCLILDCDNVLWGGILSEDGIENIRVGGNGLGRIYQDFQRFLLFLYQQGVILAVCSKNNIEDVKTVFREHGEMVLKEKHISCFMVNWENKPENIRKISDTLNIDLSSIVFVDDSEIEVMAVRALLPDVTVIQFKKYMDYTQFSCFNLRYMVSDFDIEKRTRTYQTNCLREEMKANAIDYAGYIASLNVVMTIHEMEPIEYGRVSELTQRTNKCTNGKRYTVTDIKERVQQQGVIFYSVSVSDRFSNLGLVGAMEVDNDVLSLFCLSCRALGREVEKRMISYLLERHNIIRVEFVSTSKNVELRKMFGQIVSSKEEEIYLDIL